MPQAAFADQRIYGTLGPFPWIAARIQRGLDLAHEHALAGLDAAHLEHVEHGVLHLREADGRRPRDAMVNRGHGRAR